MDGFFVGQVREEFLSGRLDLAQLEHDLIAAVKLDEGLLPETRDVPRYLRDQNGHYLIAPRELQGLV